MDLSIVLIIDIVNNKVGPCHNQVVRVDVRYIITDVTGTIDVAVTLSCVSAKAYSSLASLFFCSLFSSFFFMQRLVLSCT